jgi:hypothetical protein
MTLIVSTADLGPWMGMGEKFGIIKNRALNVLGSRAQAEAASKELIGELLAPMAND